MDRALKKIINFYRYFKSGIIIEEDLEEGLYYIEDLLSRVVPIIEKAPKNKVKNAHIHELRTALTFVRNGMKDTNVKNKIVTLDNGLHHIHRLWWVGQFHPEFRRFKEEVRKRHWLK